jgi:hypothetical protein
LATSTAVSIPHGGGTHGPFNLRLNNCKFTKARGAVYATLAVNREYDPIPNWTMITLVL